MKTRLREIRTKNNMTQRELAEILGVDPRTVSTWELGTRNPPPAKMQEIEDLYKVDKEVIFFKAFGYKM